MHKSKVATIKQHNKIVPILINISEILKVYLGPQNILSEAGSNPTLFLVWSKIV